MKRILLSSLMLLGCSSSHDKDTPQGDPVELDSFCSELAVASCGLAAKCGCFSEPDCETRTRTSCESDFLPEVQRFADLGYVEYSSGAAGNLMASVRAAECGDDLDDVIDWKLPELLTFGGIFVGTVGAGQTCERSGVDFLNACEDGVCVRTESSGGTDDGDDGEQPPQGICHPIADFGDDCDANTFCFDFDASFDASEEAQGVCRDSKCVAPTFVALGQECDDDEGTLCDDEGFCDWQSEHCEPKRAIGEPCLDEDACISGACDWEAEVCVEYRTKPEGADCAADDECASGYCGEDEMCVAAVCEVASVEFD